MAATDEGRRGEKIVDRKANTDKNEPEGAGQRTLKRTEPSNDVEVMNQRKSGQQTDLL